MEHVVPNEMRERRRTPWRAQRRVSDHTFSASHYKLIRFEYEAVCVRAVRLCLVWFLITVHAKQHYLFT